MIQSFHIFRKDAQHLWPELVLHTALLIAFALATPLAWPGAPDPSILTKVVLFFLRVLLPILWLVLIGRLVHDEALVGDQQFWITRPYTWYSLLSAKLLFLAAFVFLPFLLAQSWLLYKAGLNPVTAIPGLLLNLLFIILLCFLPFLVLAAITSTLPRLAISVVEALLYLIALAYLVSRISKQGAPVESLLATWVVLFAAALVAILVYQYASRRTWNARIALIATPLVLTLLLVATPAGPFFRHAYALSSAGPTIAFDPNPALEQPQQGRLVNFNDNFMVSLPMHLANLPARTSLNGEAAAFTLDAPGIHYSSGWQGTGLSERAIGLALPNGVFNQLHNVPVHLHIELAVNALTPATPQIVTTALHFNAPNGAACFFPTNEQGDLGAPICRYAFHGPPTTEVTGAFSPGPCPSTPTPGPRPLGITAIRTLPRLPAFDPVVQAGVGLVDPTQNPNQPQQNYFCPGTPLTFTPLREAGKSRLELDIPSIVLTPYLLHQSPPSRGD